MPVDLGWTKRRWIFIMVVIVALFLVGFAALWQSYRDPQVNLSFLSENATALVFLGCFIVAGALLVMQLQTLAFGGWRGLFLLSLVFSWGGLVLLWFIRKHPQDKKPPDLLLAPLGPVDKALFCAAGFCIFMLL